MLHCLGQLFQSALQTVLRFLFRLDAHFLSRLLLLHRCLVHARHGHVARFRLFYVDLGILGLLDIRGNGISPDLVQVVQHAGVEGFQAVGVVGGLHPRDEMDLAGGDFAQELQLSDFVESR